jgi:hypothetical protein
VQRLAVTSPYGGSGGSGSSGSSGVSAVGAFPAGSSISTIPPPSSPLKFLSPAQALAQAQAQAAGGGGPAPASAPHEMTVHTPSSSFSSSSGAGAGAGAGGHKQDRGKSAAAALLCSDSRVALHPIWHPVGDDGQYLHLWMQVSMLKISESMKKLVVGDGNTDKDKEKGKEKGKDKGKGKGKGKSEDAYESAAAAATGALSLRALCVATQWEYMTPKALFESVSKVHLAVQSAVSQIIPIMSECAVPQPITAHVISQLCEHFELDEDKEGALQYSVGAAYASSSLPLPLPLSLPLSAAAV